MSDFGDRFLRELEAHADYKGDTERALRLAIKRVERESNRWKIGFWLLIVLLGVQALAHYLASWGCR